MVSCPTYPSMPRAVTGRSAPSDRPACRLLRRSASLSHVELFGGLTLRLRQYPLCATLTPGKEVVSASLQAPRPVGDDAAGGPLRKGTQAKKDIKVDLPPPIDAGLDGALKVVLFSRCTLLRLEHALESSQAPAVPRVLLRPGLNAPGRCRGPSAHPDSFKHSPTNRSKKALNVLSCADVCHGLWQMGEEEPAPVEEPPPPPPPPVEEAPDLLSFDEEEEVAAPVRGSADARSELR